ncbi:hypothetical protein H6G41_08945 [Tolypothrix sp. FACHB-123]|uniref:hypothetical protein n=1 Tax=Tolypothrix sp. FACHB-123 TaxID=2692868 RepID=UPI0016826121|nr:hypothetical protein [Tolypothrix sp. FACHB-123]MBD2354754.1 hypothetical protein [Tolypothrix sp. FACHB-123]
MNNPVFLQVEIFYLRLQKGEYDHPFDLAKALENLADMAWDEVEELYQPSFRIDP